MDASGGNDDVILSNCKIEASSVSCIYTCASLHDSYKFFIQDKTIDGAFGHTPRSVVKRKLETPLPQPFEIPRNFPGWLMCELEKNALSIKGKSKLIADVAAAIFRYKGHLTKEEYQHVAMQIIHCFDHPLVVDM